MKREHAAYFEYFTEPPVKGSTDWTWKVNVHRIPAVTKLVSIDCEPCKKTGAIACPPECQLKCQKHACPACKGAGSIPNQVSVPEVITGTAKDLVAAREAAQKAGKAAVEKHPASEASEPIVIPIEEGK